MDESTPPPSENAPKELNKIDLSQLQDFSFGTQWSEVKNAPSGKKEGGRPPRRDYDDGPRRDGPGGGLEPRKDRRAFRKPAGSAPAGGQGSDAGSAGAPAGEAPRRFDRPQREYAGGGQGGPRPDRGDRGAPRPPQDYRPYVSPFFNIAFYPEDSGFAALVKAMRGTCHTYELFEIAKIILGKPDRFVVVMQRKPAEAKPGPEGAGVPAGKPAGPIYISVPDGVPFETEEAAVAHVIEKHLDKFYDTAAVEIDPPKGNFQVVNRCAVTGELLGPPNYHRYQQIVIQHHAAKLARMPFERFRERIETVRDPEVVNQWLEKMKKVTRYTWKTGAATVPAPVPAAPVVETPAPEIAAPAPEAIVPAGETVPPAPEATPVAAESPAPAPAAPVASGPSFDSLEEAKVHLLLHAKDKVIKAVETARFHGKLGELLPQGEIFNAIEGHLERQQRFPLDTANALRGRLRREGFTIFKKGAKGVSYVCAVKRKFRVAGQTMAESIGALISFIETHPMIKGKDLAPQYLGFTLPAHPAPAAVEGAPATPPAPALTPEQLDKVKRMSGDLRWLVTEGYVTEFADGRLFAPAPLAVSKKKSAESGHEQDEHDPEDFPEAPAEPAPVVENSAPAAEATVVDVEPAVPAEAAKPSEEASPPAS